MPPTAAAHPQGPFPPTAERLRAAGCSWTARTRDLAQRLAIPAPPLGGATGPLGGEPAWPGPRPRPEQAPPTARPRPQLPEEQSIGRCWDLPRGCSPGAGSRPNPGSQGVVTGEGRGARRGLQVCVGAAGAGAVGGELGTRGGAERAGTVGER